MKGWLAKRIDNESTVKTIAGEGSNRRGGALRREETREK